MSDREKIALKAHEKLAKQKAKGKIVVKRKKPFVLVKDKKGDRHKIVINKANLKNYSKSVRKAYRAQQTVDLKRDKGRLGLPPGKRISHKHYSNQKGDRGKVIKGGQVYYEDRLGHGDKSAKLRLEEGGQLKPLTRKERAIKYIKGLTDINTFTDPNTKYDRGQQFINHSLNMLDHLLMNAHLVLPHVTTLVRFKDGGTAEETVVLPRELVNEIEGFVKAGYNRVVGGWVTNQRRALMLVNDKGETMGVYPLQMESILEEIIANPNAKYKDGGSIGTTIADYIQIFEIEGKVYFQYSDETFFEVEKLLKEMGYSVGTTNITPADQWVYDTTRFDSSLKPLSVDNEEPEYELPNTYYLVVDMDERGEYGATVYNSNDEQVWDVDTDSMRELIEDGFLKYKADEDLERLTKYLSDNNIIPKDASIYSENFYDELKSGHEERFEGGGQLIEGELVYNEWIGGTSCYKGCYLGENGFKKIVQLSKENKNTTFLVTDDNYFNIGNFYLKNGKFAKMTVVNENYDFEKNKVSLRPKKDCIYKFKAITKFEKGGLVSDLHTQEVRLEEELRGYHADLIDAAKKEKII